jgi:O-antigen/teichoic acid export membrane protein
MAVGPTALVAAATLAGNAVAYLFAIITAHQLRPGDYGVLGSLLTVVIAVAGPGLALQAVVARRAAICERDRFSPVQLQRRVLRMSFRLGLAVTVPMVVGAPLVSDYLHLGTPFPAIWLALGLAPMPLLFAASGLLQGRQRFTHLAVVLMTNAAGKVPLGVLLVAAGLGVDGALVGIAVGAFAAAALAWKLSSGRPDDDDGLRPGRAISAGMTKELVSASLGIIGLVVLTNLDVLLARHYLPSDASGLYAAASMIAKIAYWAPLAVVVTVFPRIAISDPARRRTLLRNSSLATLAFGSLCALGALAVGHWPVLLPFGGRYRAVGGDLPLFAGIGTAFALAQLLLFSDIATGGRRTGWMVGGGVVMEALLISVAFHHSVAQIALVALGCASALVIAGSIPSRVPAGGEEPPDPVVPLEPARAAPPAAAGER